MKKMMMVMLAAALLLGAAGAYAEKTTDALQAFSALSGTNVTLETVVRTPDEYLDKVMAGDYLIEIEKETANRMAIELTGLSSVTTKDIAVYAAARQHQPEYVRNQYFRSLANVLRAEIMVNPASEEEYRNIQVILSLFLDESNDNLSRTSREAIRKSITTEDAVKIAASYSLPESFVEFIIMDEDWDDDDWQNDNSWQAGSDWNTDDLFEDSLDDYVGVLEGSLGSVDNSMDSADGLTGSLNSVDYASPASVDYASPASVDYASPASVDYASPASVDVKPAATKKPAAAAAPKNSPDYATPDYNSPKYDTPDYSAPKYNSPASVDYDSGSYDSGSYDS